MGRAIADSGGIANQYTGDGVMALFGVKTAPDTACRQALRASGAMIARIDEFSRSFGADLEEPLRLGIGIHAGPAVVGEMGYGDTRYLTAVGDTVHVASRLEALTKEYRCDLVVSEQVMARAGLSEADYPRHELTVRNREAPLRIVVIDDARRLATGISVDAASPRPACRPDSGDAPRGPARSCPPGTPRSLGHGVRMRLVGSPAAGSSRNCYSIGPPSGAGSSQRTGLTKRS